MPPETSAAPTRLLDVRGIRKVYASGGFLAPTRRVVAAEGVSFGLDRGEAVALVGESGSGKSTLARILLRLEPPDAGQILLDGEDVLAREPRRASLAYRGRVQMVFQDPFGSLNPVHTVAHHLVRPLLRHGKGLNPAKDVGAHLAVPLVLHQRATPQSVRARALDLLRTVGLEPAEDFIDRHPYELSGGQRQRVAIARALAVDPDLLVADEPTSMLDVSIRMGVLNLLLQLKKERRLGILLITHDLASARYLADRILVLYRGRVVEDGPSAAVVESPAHPYTRALLASIADSNPRQAGGGKPVESHADSTEVGCPFAARCPNVHDVCLKIDPQPREFDGRTVRCHLYPEGGKSPRS